MTEEIASALVVFPLLSDSTEVSSSWRTRNRSSSEVRSVGCEEDEAVVPEPLVWAPDGSDDVVALAYSGSATFRITD